MVHKVIEANDSGSVRPDDLQVSRLAVHDLPESRLSRLITDFKVNCKNNLCVDQTTYILVGWKT
ncbi:hypothetical protein IGI04_027166 [Brassica rapa subsp. trilocularis]|uniref:Uncharacterized protein n=1 Tax=Brassica rapa subsp. trilocularis TaxID=1813537 RepID=A0ABQ7KYA9_BRACM|nr:hypothetical protein IGI04_027166 [Brassica rapa subsp. trilocularis]